MLENQNQSTIIGSSSTAPYLNSLALKYGYCSDYVGLWGVSLPNYIILTSASNQGITADDEPPSKYLLTGPSIFDSLNTKGLSWSAFAESLPSECYQGKSTGSPVVFSVHHVPSLYYKDLVDSAPQCAKTVNITELDPTSLPTFCIVTPNNNHNSHNAPSDVPASDTWCKGFLSPILSSSDFTTGKLAIFIVYDNAWSPLLGNSPCIILWSGMTSPVVSANSYNHYDTIATIESLLGLPFLTNNDKNAQIMSEFFPSSGTPPTIDNVGLLIAAVVVAAIVITIVLVTK
ncbi:MAG: alkaline phosphatase family protein [Thermoplasmata archaeon]